LLWIALPENTPKMNIRRVDALREYDIKETPSGKQVEFSIKFVTRSGELVFLPRAVATGLPWNVAGARQRGVIPVDASGEKIGHVYPVRIDNILEWNGKTVIL
jgi:hypothetical protein